MTEAVQAVSISLMEWEQIGPELNPRLRGLVLDGVAAAQAKALESKLRIRPGFDGLQVEAMSYVGHVAVGPLRIAIRPKLTDLELTRLLRYAYGLRDLGQPLDPLAAPLAAHGLHDILVALLAAETEELLHSGLARQYVGREEWLESPRGRILTSTLARKGGVMEARLPCRHIERRVDWRLNQVLRAGLHLGMQLAEDPDLCRRMQQLHCKLDGVTPLRLDTQVVADAEGLLTRLTAVYAPALSLIRLLLEAQGLAMDPGRIAMIPGFLFDMNRFFQRLLSRFLHENLPQDRRIEDECVVRSVLGYASGYNPRGQAAPRVRPDYALIDGEAPMRFMDAKYRDVWGKGCPAEWLYQLALYALASPARVSVLLYATTDPTAREERIEVRPPALGHSTITESTVIMRPVQLSRMAELVGPGSGSSRSDERQSLARALVAAPRPPRGPA